MGLGAAFNNIIEKEKSREKEREKDKDKEIKRHKSGKSISGDKENLQVKTHSRTESRNSLEAKQKRRTN